MTEEFYDVVVMGGGAGGVAAAIRAAQLGCKVAIIEHRDFGGLCMNRGCIPLGHMMIASKILGSLSLGKAMGLGIGEVTKNYAALLERQEALIVFMRQGVTSTLRRNGVKIFEGKGKIAKQGIIEVSGRVIYYKNIILATGAEWIKPRFPGADLEEVVNTDYLFSADTLPQRVLLCGRSPWLIEVAQFLRRFGSQATLVTNEQTILSHESKTLTARLKKVLQSEMVAVKTRGKILAATKEKDGLHVDLSSKDGRETIVVDRVITLERTASLKGLGLKTINLDENSPYLRVNDKMETQVEGVYAIGDLIGPSSKHYSHLAAETGIIAAENAAGNDITLNPRLLARILFSQPEVACVGLTPKEAQNEGYDVIVGTAPLIMNGYGMILCEDEGIVEVVANKEYGELLGVHFVGTAATEMAGQALLAIQMETTLEELARIPFPHPTLSEFLAEAAREALGKAIYIP